MEIAVTEHFLADPRPLHEEADVELVGHAHAAMHLHAFLHRQRRGCAPARFGDRNSGAGILEIRIQRLQCFQHRGAVASEMVGVSEEVFGRTVAYLRERKQFGKLIGEFQALQHRAAQLYIEIEITRAAVLKALQTLDGNFENAGAAVAVAKARAGSTATLAVQEGVQMHGGMGMTDQFDIGFFMKRARVCQELFGDANYHADQLARMKSY